MRLGWRVDVDIDPYTYTAQTEIDDRYAPLSSIFFSSLLCYNANRLCISAGKEAAVLQKDKVILMTRLAMEEKKNPRQSFITRQYWFNDYVTTELWKAFFAITITFALTVLIGLIAYGDIWTVKYHISDVLFLSGMMLRIYLATLIFGLLLCALSHISLYKKAYRKQERLRAGLRRLNRIYALEDAIDHLKEQDGGNG